MSPARPELPSTRKAVSDRLRSALGGDSTVHAYYDEREEHAVAVIIAAHTPSPSLTTYATASLHSTPNEMDGRDIRVELVMVAQDDEDAVANIVATSAFFVVKNRWLAAPGVVFPHAVRDVVPGTTVPHLMWTEPFDFGDLSSLHVSGVGDIHVLQAVPLADQEREFLVEHGFDTLSSRLESAGAAHYDLHRESVC